MGGWESIVLLVAMFALMYFMMIRPENKRKKEEAKMRAELAVGDVIQTIGGVVGTICAIKDNGNVVIETGADRVRVEFIKEAVAGKRSASDESAK